MFTVCSRKIDVFFVNSVFAVVQCLAHNLKVIGSNPIPATNLMARNESSGPFFIAVMSFESVSTL